MPNAPRRSSFRIDPPVVCFGEILLRLSTFEDRLLSQSDRLELYVGGAEANVAVGLSKLGHAARMISTLPHGDLGDLAMARLAAHGVDVSTLARGPGRMGLFFLQAGASLRPSRILYDRAGSAFITATHGPADWGSLLGGAGLLHVSGVTPALGPTCAEAALAAVLAAREAGVRVSFDCNYRASLWEAWSERPEEALTAIVEKADILFGNHRDASLLLRREFTGDGGARRREASEALFSAFPNIAAIASTSRHVRDVDNHRIAARLDTRDAAWQTDEIEVSGIVDRIGSGDAFVGGILHGLLSGMDGTEVVQAGLAMACLKHSLPGDFPLFTREDLAQFAEGNLDVRR